MPQVPETHNDFRSDTFTVPTPDIIACATTASLGDDDYYEDDDTNNLGRYVADLAGKEEGLFCISGVMSNQIGLRTLLHQPPYSLLCDDRAHVYRYEGAGLSMLSNAMIITVQPSNGLYITLEDIKKRAILSESYYFPTTRVISLENTISGVIVPIEEIKKISEWARSNNLKLHLDGARLWNASAKTGIPIKEYCQYFDTISLCLSKGIGAPMGSVLVGNEETIQIAKRFRKQMGGNMRQAGLITSMAAYILKKNFPDALIYSHQLAEDVEKFCHENLIPLQLPVETNFVWLDFSKKDDSFAAKFKIIGAKHGIKVSGNRIGFHYQNSKESVELLKKSIYELYKDN